MFGNSEWLTRGTKTWQDKVYSVAKDFLDDIPERTGPVEYEGPLDEKISKFGFTDVEKLSIRTKRRWNVDEIVGYLFSLSYCSPEMLGDQKDKFEKDIRKCLNNIDEEFVQEDIETVISARRPPHSE